MKNILAFIFMILATASANAQYTGVGATVSGGGSGGAPVDCSYVMMSSCVDTTVERILTGSAGRISVIDGGAGNAVTLDLVASGVTLGTYGDASNIPVLTIDTYGRITVASEVAVSGGGGGVTDADFWVSTAHAGLSAEKIPVGGAGLTLTLGTATFDVNVANGLQIASDAVEIAASAAGTGLTFTTGVFNVVSGNSAIVANANDITFVGDNGLSYGIATGTCAAPSLFFTPDSGDNTGLARINEDEISFTTGGTCRVRIDANAIFPVTNNSLDLGKTAQKYRDAFVSRNMTIGGEATASGAIILNERDSDNGSSSYSISAPDSLAANIPLILPTAQGSDGYVLQLQTASTGQLVWSAGGGCSADAPVGASYFTVGLDATLTFERDVTNIAGSGLTSVDGGANGTFVMAVGAGTGISVSSNAVALDLAASPTWTGTHTFNGPSKLGSYQEWNQVATQALAGNNILRSFMETGTTKLPESSYDGMPYFPMMGAGTPYSVLNERMSGLYHVRDTDDTVYTGQMMPAIASVSGTASHASNGDHEYISHLSGTTIGNAAGIKAANDWSRWQNRPVIAGMFRTPTTGTLSTGMTLFVCLQGNAFAEAVPTLTATANTSRAACFARDDTVAGGNILFGSIDGTNQDYDDTGIAYAPDTDVYFVIAVPDATTVYGWWNGNVVSRTANFPGTTQTCGAEILIVTRDTNAKSLAQSIIFASRKF